MNIPEIKEQFLKIYGGSDADLRVFASPGRVNLIGEHVDYCGGCVFPAALTMKTTIVARKRNDDVIRLKATDLDIMVETTVSQMAELKDKLKWGDYQIGVALELMKAGYDICGCDLLYDDTVPHGGGLSSSAAIEVSTALMFATFSNEKNGVSKEIDMIEMAKLSQLAEHNFIGVNCGIMDQFASANGKKDMALFLKCDNLEFSHVPVVLQGAKLVLSNTNKKHKLSSSAYNERRSQCEEGFAILKEAMPEKTCLGEISPGEFEKSKHLIKDPVIRNRVTHVIYEDDRVLRSVEALKNGDIALFGKLMNESHASLRDLYEVTGIELDTLAEAGQNAEGVLGSRMTGGGFGGCTVSIVKEDKVEDFIKTVGEAYKEKIGYEATFYAFDISDGAREIK